MKTGILGGTFDPIHNGHVLIAGEVMKQLDLDTIIFIPAPRSPFKMDTEVAAIEHRVKMVHLAIAGISGFSVSEIEIERAGPSYTVDTLELLHKGSEKAAELYFIIGLDSLETLPGWRHPEQIVKLCRIVAVGRPGHEIPHLIEIENSIPGLSESLILLDKPQIDISSTGIRKRIQQGLPVDELIPSQVDDYIKEHRLYR